MTEDEPNAGAPHDASTAKFVLKPACEEDFEALAALRLAAMRESLDRVGRFDPHRSRERLRSGFQPAHTRHIVVAGRRVGFVVVKPREADLLLEHLYLAPHAQGSGIGAAVLRHVFAEADAVGQALTVSALRDSASNRFYLRHGFEQVAEREWDIDYVRPARTRIKTSRS